MADGARRSHANAGFTGSEAPAITEAERQRVTRLIEAVVRGACVPSRREREELRRELWTHFEEQPPGELMPAISRFGDADVVAGGLRRAYRREYLLFQVRSLLASIGASAIVAVLIQLVANLRRGAGAWHLAPQFPKAALISVAVAIALVAMRAALRRPFTQAKALTAFIGYLLIALLVQAIFGRGLAAFVAALVIVAIASAVSQLKIRPARLVLTYAALCAALYALHQRLALALAQLAGMTTSAALPLSRAAPMAPMSLPQALAASAALLAVFAVSLAVLARLDRVFGILIDQT